MRKTGFWMMAGTLAFAFQATAQPSEVAIDRRLGLVDTYYRDPHAPGVFRALSGMGDPDAGGPPYRTGESYAADWRKRLADKELLLHDKYGGWNCRIEAPMKTLDDRRAALGADHPYVKQWIRVEQAVLSVCADNGSQTVAALPPPLEMQDPKLALLQKQDRAYQEAALRFYESDIAGTFRAYQAIAADKSSPHRPNAAYMVVAIQAGSRPYAYGKMKSDLPRVPLEESLRNIRRMLADPSLSEAHTITAGLVGWLGWNGDPAARRVQVRETFSVLKLPLKRIRQNAVLGRRYATAVDDLHFLHSDFPDPAWWLNGKIPPAYTASRAMAGQAGHDEFAAWILWPENPYRHRPWTLADDPLQQPEIVAYLDARLRGRRKNDPANPWVHVGDRLDIAVLSKLVDGEVAALSSPAADDRTLAELSFDFPSLVRRLVMGGGDKERNFVEALKVLRRFPAKSSEMYVDSERQTLRYLMMTGRIAEARRLRDTLKLDVPARDHPYQYSDLLLVLAEDEDHMVKALNQQNFHPSEYLNALPIAEMWRLAARSELDGKPRALFARTAWTRTYALGFVIDARQNALMRSLNPEIVARWRSAPDRDVRPDDHRVLMDVLTSPELNLVIKDVSRVAGSYESKLVGMDYYNHNDNNWWCAWDFERNANDLDSELRDGFGVWDYRVTATAALEALGPQGVSLRRRLQPLLSASFLFRSVDRGELTVLSKIDCAPKMLGLRAIEWVKHPGWFESRAGQDEALANAVVTTRYGCTRQGSHAAYSREAYRLLHLQFPKSAAAARTKYWFACPLEYDGVCPEDRKPAAEQ